MLSANWKPMPILKNKGVGDQGLERLFRSCLEKKNQTRKEHLEDMSWKDPIY